MKHPAVKPGGMFTPTPPRDGEIHCKDCEKRIGQTWEIYQIVQAGEVVRPLCAVCFDRRRSAS